MKKFSIKKIIIFVLVLAGILGALLIVYKKRAYMPVLEWFNNTFAKEDGAPDYVEKHYLTKNPKSRCGDSLEEVHNIVIHYVANPGSSAINNRNYFEGLMDPVRNPGGTSASAHFIVGLEGEIVQCIPLYEVAYANYPRNNDTISIEVCHPDGTGKFSDITYESLVKLSADLLKRYNLSASDLLRHYDISGKNCPKYYVEQEGAWEKFLSDVEKKIEQ